ncbi:MAG: hypothetical protein J2P46_19195, partial [Zavarzinella sp.]|nr:hypothetical protein [Zavarzinella sp.]
RQRKMKMPVSMTATWMGLGAVLIIAFVVAGALLPRPFSETPIWNPTRAMTQERKASDYAVNRDSGGKGEGRSGEQATKGDGEATGKGGEPGAKGKSGEAKSGSGEKQGKTGDRGDKSGGSEGKQSGEAKGEEKGREGKDSGREANATQKQGNKTGSNAAERFQHTSVGNALSKLADVLKWIMFVVLAIVVLFVVFRHGLRFLSNFMPWAKNLLAAIDAWLKGLFGRREKEVEERVELTPAEAVESRVPFAAFSNPFADGTAGGRSPEELVRYSFEALEAWAGDREVPRRADETPIEFANRLGESFRWIRPGARNLAILVARMAYAGGNLPAGARQALSEFWARITSGADETIDEAVEVVE